MTYYLTLGADSIRNMLKENPVHYYENMSGDQHPRYYSEPMKVYVKREIDKEKYWKIQKLKEEYVNLCLDADLRLTYSEKKWLKKWQNRNNPPSRLSKFFTWLLG